MAGKNDILATAGVDLSAFEAGIAKLTSRLDAVEQSGSRAASGIERVDKSASRLKNIVVADHLVNALGQIAGRGGAAAEALGAMDLSVAKNDFSGTGIAAAGFNASLGRTVDIVSQLPGALGVAGKAAGAVAGIMSEATIRNNAFADTMNKASASTAGFLEQSQKLAALQSEEIQTGGDVGKLESMASARDRAAKGYTSQIEKQIKLEEDLTAGGQQRLAIELEEVAAKQKIADLAASQTVQGVISPAGQAVIDAGSKEINSQLELRKKALRVTEEAEKQETLLSNIVAKRDVTLKSQLDVIEASGDAAREQLKAAEQQGLGQTKLAADLRVKLNEQLLAKENFYYINGKDLEQQKLITAQINAQAAGNKKLAALAQIRAQFELQIADAIRQGNKPKAQELAKQQAAAELGARAADIRKTPQERRLERKEQDAQDKAMRLANARDKDRADRARRGAYGQKDSLDHVSKATEKARKEFEARHAPANLKAAAAAR